MALVDRDTADLCNVWTLLVNSMMSHCWRPQSSAPQLWQPHITQPKFKFYIG